MKKIPIYQIDAFTDKLFAGNPAAVCPIEQWLPDEVMQKISKENNLSETAFFTGKDGKYQIRWFTPTVEVELCGHATLASAYVIFNHLDYTGNEVIFSSRSGDLPVSRKNDLLCLNFPAAALEQQKASGDLLSALGIKSVTTSYKSSFFLLELESEVEVRNIIPDMKALKAVEGVSAVIITAKGKNSDFVSRVFAPAAGIDEDPVTGSAHTVLVPYWAKKTGKKELHALQVSERGGELFCRLLDNRVEIAGKAVTYMTGEIII